LSSDVKPPWIVIYFCTDMEKRREKSYHKEKRNEDSHSRSPLPAKREKHYEEKKSRHQEVSIEEGKLIDMDSALNIKCVCVLFAGHF